MPIPQPNFPDFISAGRTYTVSSEFFGGDATKVVDFTKEQAMTTHNEPPLYGKFEHWYVTGAMVLAGDVDISGGGVPGLGEITGWIADESGSNANERWSGWLCRALPVNGLRINVQKSGKITLHNLAVSAGCDIYLFMAYLPPADKRGKDCECP